MEIRDTNSAEDGLSLRRIESGAEVANHFGATLIVVGKELGVRERGGLFPNKDGVGVELKRLIDADPFPCLDSGNSQWVFGGCGHGRLSRVGPL